MKIQDLPLQFILFQLILLTAYTKKQPILWGETRLKHVWYQQAIILLVMKSSGQTEFLLGGFLFVTN